MPPVVRKLQCFTDSKLLTNEQIPTINVVTKNKSHTIKQIIDLIRLQPALKHNL